MATDQHDYAGMKFSIDRAGDGSGETAIWLGIGTNVLLIADPFASSLAHALEQAAQMQSSSDNTASELPLPGDVATTPEKPVETDAGKSRGGEAVAWRYKHPMDKEWHLTDNENMRKNAEAFNLEIETLYNAPTDQRAEPDAGRLMECINELSAEVKLWEKTYPNQPANGITLNRYAAIISSANEQAGEAG